MKLEREFFVNVTLLPTDEGGRKSSTPSNYFGCPVCIEDKYYECRLRLEDIGPLSPGGHYENVPIMFLNSELMSRLKIGQKMRLWDGRFIGEAIVVKIL